MHIIKSVSVMSVAKIMRLLYGCLGLIFLPFLLILSLAGFLAGHSSPFAGFLGLILAIFLPIFYGVMGFIMGAISAFLYNVAANWVGGFELQLELKRSEVQAPYPVIPPPTPGI